MTPTELKHSQGNLPKQGGVRDERGTECHSVLPLSPTAPCSDKFRTLSSSFLVMHESPVQLDFLSLPIKAKREVEHMKPIRMLCFALLAVVVGVSALHDADAREPGLRVAAVKLLSEKGSTRSTRYSTANKIVTVGGKTHVAWLDSVSQFPLKSHFPSLFPSICTAAENARPLDRRRTALDVNVGEAGEKTGNTPRGTPIWRVDNALPAGKIVPIYLCRGLAMPCRWASVPSRGCAGHIGEIRGCKRTFS